MYGSACVQSFSLWARAQREKDCRAPSRQSVSWTQNRCQIRMMMRSAWFLPKGFKRSVIPFQLSADVLSVRFVLDCRLCYSVFLRIFQKGLTKPHILCYTIHSNCEPPLLLFWCDSLTVTGIGISQYSQVIFCHLITQKKYRIHTENLKEAGDNSNGNK